MFPSIITTSMDGLLLEAWLESSALPLNLRSSLLGRKLFQSLLSQHHQNWLLPTHQPELSQKKPPQSPQKGSWQTAGISQAAAAGSVGTMCIWCSATWSMGSSITGTASGAGSVGTCFFLEATNLGLSPTHSSVSATSSQTVSRSLVSAVSGTNLRVPQPLLLPGLSRKQQNPRNQSRC